MMVLQGPPPTHNYLPMLEACGEALRQAPSEWTFKGDHRYREILEHLRPEQAEEIIIAAQERFPEALRRLAGIAAENDSLGQPVKTHFASVGVMCSPSNLRYLWHACLVLDHLRSVNVRQTSVVEIGAGYGGLALYVHRLANLFSVGIERYTTVDLPQMAALQQRFGEALGLSIEGVDGSDGFALQRIVARPEPKVLCSIYAFAEFDEATQDWYAEQIIRHCEHGFVLWNYAPTWLHRGPNPLYAFIDRPLRVVGDTVPDYRLERWHMLDVTW